MSRENAGLDSLSRRERDALRTLLVRTVAVAGRSTDLDRLEQLVAEAPVGELPEAAALHRVAGTTRRALEGVAGVAEVVRAELTAVSQESSLHHLLVIGALNDIGRAFDDGGLSWAVMKGPVVAARLYPGVGDRSYADLDLLVHRRDFPEATRILERLGFRHVIRNWALAEEMLAGQVVMSSPRVNIDLHWHLHYSHEDRRPYSLDPEAMLERARRVPVSGVYVPTLDAVDTLITIAFHAARSGGHRLIWLKDVERAAAIEGPDPDELQRRCEEYRCAPPVGLILGRARTLLDAEIPEELVRAMTPAGLSAADRITSLLSDPVQLHERHTLNRALTRSARSTAVASLTAVPSRAARWLRNRLRPPRQNETDDPSEKASYLRAVASSTPG